MRIAQRARSTGLAMLLTIAATTPVIAQPEAPMRIRVLGGLAGLPQYTQLEEPFWANHIPQVTGGRLIAEIAPFDRSGIRAQESLRTLRLGVTPFGTVLLGSGAAEIPELSALEMPAVAPDMATLRRVVEAGRPWIAEVLRERHGIELLGVYTYAAQVVACTRPFAGLSDLRGRRIRTSAPAQGEVLAAMGATPVVIPFAETVPALRTGVVECAVTGAMGGWQTGLAEVATHVHPMAFTWGVSLFLANRDAWAALPPATREVVRSGIRGLEDRIWDAAEREMGQGLDCYLGRPGCTPDLHLAPDGRRRPRGRLSLVALTGTDEALRRRIVEDVVLPRWASRCGRECSESWNTRLGQDIGLLAPTVP